MNAFLLLLFLGCFLFYVGYCTSIKIKCDDDEDVSTYLVNGGLEANWALIYCPKLYRVFYILGGTSIVIGILSLLIV